MFIMAEICILFYELYHFTKLHFLYNSSFCFQCMPFITIDTFKEMLPSILELTKSPQLGTKAACAHFLVLAAHYLRSDLELVAGRIMPSLLNGIFDRNATVRKNYAEALGQVSAYAKVRKSFIVNSNLYLKTLNSFRFRDKLNFSAICRH